MFGYIKPLNSELLVREQELYRAVYCGLCRAMHTHTCRISTFSLSYDFVFLALFRTITENDYLTIKQQRCGVHPLRRRQIAYSNTSLEYTARAAAVLSYYKLNDDINDEKGTRRAAGFIVRPTFSRIYKKANMSTDFIEGITAPLKRLSTLESNNSSVPDECADCFGDVMAHISSWGLTDVTLSRAACSFGMHIGRWIYLLDACDDFSDDKKRGRFNPFLSYDSLPASLIENSLLCELESAERALDIISPNTGNPIISIIHNILRLGMPHCADSILNSKNKGAEPTI